MFRLDSNVGVGSDRCPPSTRRVQFAYTSSFSSTYILFLFFRDLPGRRSVRPSFGSLIDFVVVLRDFVWPSTSKMTEPFGRQYLGPTSFFHWAEVKLPKTALQSRKFVSLLSPSQDSRLTGCTRHKIQLRRMRLNEPSSQ